MANFKKIGLTFLQMLVGCCSGILAGGVLLYLINIAWGALEGAHIGGFLKALLLLVSFLIVFGATVAATAEGVRQMGRFIPKQTSLRKIYEGSFLGMCTAVAFLTATRSDWLNTLEEWSGPVRLLGTLIYYILVLPVKYVTIWLPPLFLLIIAAPIGAAIGYNLPPFEKKKQETEAPEKQPETQKGRKKRL